MYMRTPTPEPEETIYTSRLEPYLSGTGGSIATAEAVVSPSKTAPYAKEKIHTLDPDDEYSFWEESYVLSDITQDRNFSISDFTDTVGPAYRFGISLYIQNGGQAFEDLEETVVLKEWKKSENHTELPWELARQAMHSAYMRLYRRYSAGVL
jgi:hypothetical protein